MKYFKFEKLQPEGEITLQLPNEYPINGKIVETSGIVFISYLDKDSNFGNDIFFTKCGITNPQQFLLSHNIKGPLFGKFPEIASIEELYKALQYIEDFYDEIRSIPSSINRMSEDLSSEINDINRATKALYEKYIKYISYLWNELKSSSIINLYDPSFTNDEKIQKFRSKRINRNNTIYTTGSFCWCESQDCVFIGLQNDRVHFGQKLYRNRENVSMSEITLLMHVFDMISYLLTEYSHKSVWEKK